MSGNGNPQRRAFELRLEGEEQVEHPLVDYLRRGKSVFAGEGRRRYISGRRSARLPRVRAGSRCATCNFRHLLVFQRADEELDHVQC